MEGKELRCQYCGKTATSQSGLTLHMKVCKMAPANAPTESQPSPQSNYITPDDSAECDVDPRDVDPRDIDPRFAKQPEVPMRRPQQPKEERAPFNIGPKNGGNIGAFQIISDHILVFLDVNFAVALAEQILANGSDNRAIMAFAHQLKKLDE